jgi:hypothetical protein
VSLQLPGFMVKSTAGNNQGQLAGGGVWVQVAKISKGQRKFKIRTLQKKRSLRRPALGGGTEDVRHAICKQYSTPPPYPQVVGPPWR